MGRDFFTVEKGFRIVGENTNVGVSHLFGAGAPGTQVQENDCEVGSLYNNTTDGSQYTKFTAGSGTDKWVRLATYTDVAGLKWRSEQVAALTSTAAPIEGATIDLGAVHLGGDETPFLVGSDFTVGEYILFGAGGTEVLAKISNIATDVLTFTYIGFSALSAGDTFVVKNYLPDSPGTQEAQAIVLFNGSAYIKIGDVNWDFATGINIAAGYTAASGNPSSADTVQSALEKIDGNVDAINTLTGIVQGGTDLGVFTGTIIPDSSTVKAALQALETKEDALITLSGVASGAVDLGNFTGVTIADNSTVKVALQSLETSVENIQVAGTLTAITTAQTVDSVLVDNYGAVEWYVQITLDSAPARKVVQKLHAMHDGTTSADAANVDDTIFGKIQLGSGFNYTVSVDLNGSAGAQIMRLRVAATSAVTVKFIRRAIA
jgi:hypothetical protein